MIPINRLPIRRVGHHDFSRAGCVEIDVFDPRAEIGDQFEPFACRRQHLGVDVVGDCRDKNVTIGDRDLQFVLGKGLIVRRQCNVEQFGHARFDMRHQLAGDDDAWAFGAG